ncbi:MAG TPA: tetratricopeptide repeat protein [Pirellulales bacterium]|nr:tetratricopeptide repeat protein [Pirellulales bacterium]
MQPYLVALQCYRRGIAPFKQGAYADAVWEFSEAIRWKPDSAASYHWRAVVLIEVRQFGAALADMNRSLSLRPANPAALHARAALLERLGRYREAYADIVEALRLSPGNLDYLKYLSRLRARIDVGRMHGADLPWTLSMKDRASSHAAVRALTCSQSGACSRVELTSLALRVGVRAVFAGIRGATNNPG